MKITEAEAICWCARMVCMSHLLACIELLLHDRVLRPDGMMSWDVMRVRGHRYVHPRWSRLLDWLYSYPRVRRLIAVQLALSVVILFSPNRWILFPFLLPLLALADLTYGLRCDYGNDGSDQMTTLVTLSLAVGVLLPHAGPIALGFLALQACLAYGIAGWAKAFRRPWWTGTYAIAVTKTRTFGNPAFGEFLDRHRRVAAVMSSCMVAWEMAFPLVLILPLPAALAVMAVGASFHVFNAFHMGLNTFVWAFGATYPALVFILCLRGF